MGCQVSAIACGGSTHFAVAPDEGNTVMTVGWGQGASNGELAFGEDQPKNSTKPQKIAPLAGVDVFRWVYPSYVG